MYRRLFFIACCIFPLLASSQNKDVKDILSILDRQIEYWNKGDVDHFMEGYWNNDSLMFIGQSGVTYGYQNTLNNYKKNYKDTAHMGKLQFTILQVKPVSADAYFVVGKWQLFRTVGNVDGYYTLLFRKIKGVWVIVADHSS